MKLSTNFLKDYVDIDVDVKTLAEDMTRVGNEYDYAGKFIEATNLVIGEIVSCVAHPDSDHLHICMVNIGTETLQIVCGAPNARVGIKVIVALPGAQLPGEITIRKGSIRGVESNGMLCSMAELGLESKFLEPEDKLGIHELPQNAPLGEDPIKFMQMNDGVIDFELTANRGDLLSILGMAYEAGAIYNKPINPIDLSHKEAGYNITHSFKVDIQTGNCSLFLAKKVENVTIAESPTFIKNRLMASGIRPINNVVDISNYVMLEVGQPLHFYDADRLGNKIIVRMANNGEKLTTLDNEERTLDENDIVIATDKSPIGLAGVMGGLTTEVEDYTKNIIIESAIFDGVKVRKTSNKIVRSEASNRFEKGLDPNRTYMAVERACHLLEKYAGATIVSGICVYDTTEKQDKEIKITVNNINEVLGTNLTEDDVIDVFKRLKFTGYAEEGNISVLVPRRRLDINIKEDLIEEVGRIYGVDNIEGKLPVLPIKAGSYNKTIRAIRSKMASLGLNETLTYVLVNEREADKFTADSFENLKLLAPLTEERNTLRYSLIPSMLKTYEYNKARNIKDVSIFEIGKGFYKKSEEYGENNKLCVLMSGEYYLGLGNKQNVDFYIIKGIAEEILDYLGYANRYSFIHMLNKVNEFHPGQCADISVNNDVVGSIAKLHPSVTPDDVYVLEINLDKLLEKKTGKMKYKEISKFPSVKKDLAFVMNRDVESKEIETVIKKSGGSILTNIEVFDVYTGNNVADNEKSIAYNLTFMDTKKTLTDEEVNAVFEKIISSVEGKCNAKLRR